MCIYPIGATAACGRAAELLAARGIPIIDHPSPEVTALLLDVPAFRPDGALRSGENPEPILAMLPGTITILGGNLNHPVLTGYRKVDLLQNEAYLTQNAAITADCALRLAGSAMKSTFRDTDTLVIGWGRIGKCLASLLRQVGSHVTVAARKPADRYLAEALGYGAISIPEVPRALTRFGLLFNTVPEPVLEQPIPGNCIAVELASRPGIPVENTIAAPGLPGAMAPKSSGKLIAETILCHLQEETL